MTSPGGAHKATHLQRHKAASSASLGHMRQSQLCRDPPDLPWVSCRTRRLVPETAPTGEVPGGQHGGEDGSLKDKAEGKGVLDPSPLLLPPSLGEESPAQHLSPSHWKEGNWPTD